MTSEVKKFRNVSSPAEKGPKDETSQNEIYRGVQCTVFSIAS